MQNKIMLAGLVLIMGMALGIQPASASRVSRVAKITSLVGQVEWLKSGSDKCQACSEGQPLSEGDKIRTGTDGQATLTLDEGSTIQLSPGSEFTIQSLAKESASEQLESVLALMKGKLKAQVTPLKQGSKFEIETPAMVAAVRGTTFNIAINADGSIDVGSDDGAVDLIRQGLNKFLAQLESGDEALIEYDPISGDIKITCVKGSFQVTGPDGSKTTLNQGDSIVFKAGAATFISITDPVAAPPGETFPEPTNGSSESSSSAAHELSSPVSGSE